MGWSISLTVSLCPVKTSTKIMIRGKGATKEGKLGRAGLPQPGEDEPLHALITGNTPEIVKNAVDKVSLSLFWMVWIDFLFRSSPLSKAVLTCQVMITT